MIIAFAIATTCAVFATLGWVVSLRKWNKSLTAAREARTVWDERPCRHADRYFTVSSSDRSFLFSVKLCRNCGRIMVQHLDKEDPRVTRQIRTVDDLHEFYKLLKIHMENPETRIQETVPNDRFVLLTEEEYKHHDMNSRLRRDPE